MIKVAAWPSRRPIVGPPEKSPHSGRWTPEPKPLALWWGLALASVLCIGVVSQGIHWVQPLISASPPALSALPAPSAPAVTVRLQPGQAPGLQLRASAVEPLTPGSTELPFVVLGADTPHDDDRSLNEHRAPLPLSPTQLVRH